MTIISLFSGAGGLDLGLIQAGNDVVWANDIDADAVATYKYCVEKNSKTVTTLSFLSFNKKRIKLYLL